MLNNGKCTLARLAGIRIYFLIATALSIRRLLCSLLVSENCFLENRLFVNIFDFLGDIGSEK